jgi:hypothetical protein
MLKLFVLSLLLSLTAFSICVIAQTWQGPEEELLSKGRVFDLSNEEKKRETISSFINAAADGEDRIVELYLEAGIDINSRDEFDQTALFGAVVERKYALAMMLLSRGADPNLASDKGRTPLLAAIKRDFDTSRYVRSTQSEQLIKTLLDKSTNVNVQDKEGKTPLIEAAAINDAETIKSLVEKGADVKLKNSDGQTALDIVARGLRGLAVKALIENGGAYTLKQKLQYYCYKFARLQGWMLPGLIVVSFFIGYFGKKLTRPNPKRNAVTKGDELPHLVPLKCRHCGGGVPLKAENMSCPYCGSNIPVPEDYAVTMRLRAKVSEQMAKAVAAWRRANLFTIWPIRWLLWFLSPIWLFAIFVGLFSNIGDSLFAIKTSTSFLALFALLGGISFSLALWAYAFYLNGTRKRLPVIPTVGQQVGEAELTSCQLCGGSISYAAGDLVAICGYCGVETYRVRLTRHARHLAAEEKEKATLSLYDAMAEIAARRQQAFKYLLNAAKIIFGLAVLIAIYFT